MYPTRVMRLLRLKHHISLAELSRSAKISPQRMSQIELAAERSTEYQRQLVAEAFAIIAQERGKGGNALRRDLRRLEYCLLDFVEEELP